MKRVIGIAVLLCLCIPNTIQSQAEASNWYFGKEAGITFNTDGSVTPLTNGKLDTQEGCTTISDSLGNLLFYTDGSIVYDKNHSVMPNGTDLKGDSSSTQSALIVPKPSDDNIFYIFTVDAVITNSQPTTDGLNYSIVDISKNNGLGEVTQKNINLLTESSEKVTAVIKDCTKQTIWLITFASPDGSDSVYNTFHAFEISETGVMPQPVRSTIPGLNVTNGRGYLKVSPDGKKLASANLSDGLFVYDFDTITGTVSNQEQIVLGGGLKSYGVEFSPNSQYLYIHAIDGNNNKPTAYLLQYDVLAANIQSSLEILHSELAYRGALQLGPNGKIYRTSPPSFFSNTSFLSVINEPNKKGNAANYVHNAIPLTSGSSNQGLPPFIQSFFNIKPLVKNQDGTTSNFLEICERESFTLELDAIPGVIYTWEKDDIPITNTTNTLHVPSATVNDTGNYRLTITFPNSPECPIVGESQITVKASIEPTKLSLEECDNDSDTTDGIRSFNLNDAIIHQDVVYTFYANAQDQNTDTPILDPENYTNTQAFSQKLPYKITNPSGCEDFQELTLVVKPVLFTSNLGSPISTCDINAEDNLLEGNFDLDVIKQNLYGNVDTAFYATQSDAVLEQNPISGNLTSSNTTKTIYVRIENGNQCKTAETIELIINPAPSTQNIPLTIKQCDIDSNTADGTSLFDLEGIIQDPNIDYTFYANAQDLANNIPITNPQQYTNSQAFSQTVSYKIENQFDCENFGELTLVVEPIVFTSSTESPISICDPNALDNLLEATFDLNTIEQNLYNPLDATFYTTQSDAVLEQNPISGNLTTSNTTLYVRIENSNECKTAESIDLIVNPLPSKDDIPLTLEQCDIDSDTSDGITLFNLTQVIQDPDIDFVFYKNLQDQANDMAILTPEKYTNDQAFSQTILYKITNEFLCEDFGELALIVNPNSLVLSPESPLLTCDDTTEDNVLKGTFDLEEIRGNLYGTLDVIFYKNLSDASLEENPLDGNFTSSDTTIYARIENANQCQNVEIIDLIVKPLPDAKLEEFYQVCTEGEPLLIDAPSGFDRYTWYRTTEQLIEEIGDTPQILISEAGNYSLEIVVNHQSGGETITCSTTVDFEVRFSSKAVFDQIIITDLSKTNTIAILVSGSGSYEYSLDGLSYTDNTLFENVAPGFYTVFVRDKNGCGISEEEIAVVGFSKFFTPNGDGTNDYWQIIGASTDLVSGSITIYDRYGKLIKQMTPNDTGWDGTLNGKLLPSSDYWFSANLMNKKQLRGHFTLKR